MTKAQTKKVDDLMSQYATLNQQRKDLLDSIMPELKVIEEGMKEKQLQLIDLGNLNKESFDEKGNLMLTDGYLHIAKVTQVNLGKKFDLKAFADAFPQMMSVEPKVAPIKKAFLDAELRKELKKHGVSVDTDDKMEVKLHKQD
jgi:hypothetical protein